MSLKRWLPLVLAVAAVVAIAVLRGPDDSGEPLDPRSTGPLGARALVLLLEEHGVEVTIGADPPALARASSDATRVALLLADELGETQSDELRRWVDDGGTLVVADPFSQFAPALAPPDNDLFDPEAAGADLNIYEPGCEFAPVRAIDLIRVPSAALLRVRDNDVACFRRGEGAYLVARSEGDGTVVALGGGGPLVNETLADEGNAALAIGLLAPRPGRVVVLEPDAAGSGRRSLFDLVSQDVSSGLWQLAVAFVVIALWRARRLGRPVVETDPVVVPGSELVVAVGNLLQHAKRRDAAAEMLRLQARRELCEQLGLPMDAPAEALADSAAAVSGVDRALVLSVLSATHVLDDASLVALAKAVESLRREVAHV